jgi:hypothetical protein
MHKRGKRPRVYCETYGRGVESVTRIIRDSAGCFNLSEYSSSSTAGTKDLSEVVSHSFTVEGTNAVSHLKRGKTFIAFENM